MPSRLDTAAPLATAALAVAVAFAAEAPDGRKTLERVARAYWSLTSFHFEARVTTTMIKEGTRESFDFPFIAAAGGFGRSRSEIVNPSMGMAVVSDGKTTITYSQQLNQYTRTAVTPRRPPGVDSLGVKAGKNSPIARYYRITDDLVSARLLGTQTLRIDGRPFECEVVEAEFKHPPTLPAQYSPTRFWIDSKRSIVLRESSLVKIEVPGGTQTAEVAQTTSFVVSRLNEPVPDSLFAFRPPPGATEVKSFGGEQAVDLSGQRAEDFTLRDLAGTPVKLSSLRGKVVMLDFWATWCGPCRIEMPFLQKLHTEFKAKGLVVLGVNQGEDATRVKPFLKKNGYSFRILLDSDQKIGTRYQVTGIPTLFIIDKAGKISSHFVGVRDEDVLREALAKVGIL